MENLNNHEKNILRDDQEKVLVNSWDVTIKNSDGEAERHTNYQYSYPIKSDLESIQARETEIKFRRRKVGNQACKTLAIFGDAHIGYRQIGNELVPTHDEKALTVAKEIIYDVSPNIIVNLGDHLDLAILGRYDPDSNQFANTLQASIDRGHEYMAELRGVARDARILELQGNHDARIKRTLAKRAVQLMGLKQAGTDREDIFSYEHLMNYNPIGVEYVSGYPAGEIIYSDDLHIKHGSDLRSNGSTAELLSKKYPYHGVIQGHGHKMQLHQKTLPDGRVFNYYMNPILGKTTGEIPGYGTAIDDHDKVVEKQEDWQQGITIVEDYGDGHYNFMPINIIDGVAYFQGKKYEAR